MIKPDEVPTSETRDTDERKQLERYIDRALALNKTDNQWPLEIQQPRSSFQPRNIEVVLQKYRDAGVAGHYGSRLPSHSRPSGDAMTHTSLRSYPNIWINHKQ